MRFDFVTLEVTKQYIEFRRTLKKIFYHVRNVIPKLGLFIKIIRKLKDIFSFLIFQQRREDYFQRRVRMSPELIETLTWVFSIGGICISLFSIVVSFSTVCGSRERQE